MGRRKNVEPHHIDICSNCDKEVTYGDVKNRITVCPDCGKRLIQTDAKCYEVVKLLKEINLKPIWAYSFGFINKDGVGKLCITIYFDMPYAEAMFSALPNFQFYNKNGLIVPNKNNLIVPTNAYINKNGSALQCRFDSITNADVQQLFDTYMQELKGWCKDYQENYEGRWAVGKLAGWLD